MAAVEDSKTVFLAHFNGADEATSHTAISGQTITFGSGAKLDSARTKFGATSLYLDGSANGYVTIPDSANWVFGSEAFTVDFWINWDMGTSNNGFLWGQVVDGNNRGPDFGLETNQPYIYGVEGGVEKCNYNMSLTPTADTWYHYEVCRTADTMKFFITGTGQTLTATTALPAGYSFPDLATTFNIGKATNGAHGYPKCWIDEFRVSKGVARHTSNFTAPTAPYIWPTELGGSFLLNLI